MKILFEDYTYKTQLIRDILGNFVLPDVELLSKDTQQLRYVGYFYSKATQNEDDTHGDIVFILPKVLLDEEGKAFGLPPEQLVNFNWEEWKKDELIVEEGKLNKRQVYDFLYGFAVWIYRAIDVYRRKKDSQIGDHDKSKMTEVYSSVQLGASGKKEESTFMDVMLSLLDFQRTHKDFITYVIKLAHSGNNKISWARTIARTQAYIQDDTPLYLNPINKKKVVNFDEELLIIFYSILNYMHEEYGFPIPNQPGYKLIKGAMFESYLEGQGKTRLHKIRYKYYSDSAILLWNLCYAFFDKTPLQKGRTDRKDFLLVPSFHCVFEAMIDELVGDKDLPKYLKDQDDNKHIDHIYRYKYLMENMESVNDVDIKNKIYNIADSKYHKRNSKLEDTDVAKQFTYARNVIQWHMNVLHDILNIKDKSVDYKPIQLYDKLTRGYNIIPNFFISAFADEELNYDKDNFDRSTLGGIKRDSEGKVPWVKTYDIKGKGNVHEQVQFYDRLFDRNTLFTLHYDVNFLYILKSYAQNKSYNKESWKELVRNKFREGILDFLNQEFTFYQLLIPEREAKDLIRKYFFELEGKVFSFATENNKRVFIYAERNGENDPEANKYQFEVDEDVHIETSEGVSWLKITIEDTLYAVKNIKLGIDYYDDVEGVTVSSRVETIECIPAQNLNATTLVPLAEISEDIAEDEAEDIVVNEVWDETDVDEEDKYVKFLPLYTIKAACGKFLEADDDAQIKGWINIEEAGIHRHGKEYYVVQASGESMLPKVHDGAYCVFRAGGSVHGGDIVIAGIHDQDPCYNGRYTIKKISQQWGYNEDGERVRESVTLIPLNNNGEYPTFEIDAIRGDGFGVFGVLEDVINGKKSRRVGRQT